MFKVAVGPHAGERVMTGKLSFSENALWKTFPILRGFGITDDFLQQANAAQDPIQTIADAMAGRVVEATVIVDNWQGEDRNKLERTAVGAAAGAAPPPPPPPAPAAETPAAPPPPPPPAADADATPAPKPSF